MTHIAIDARHVTQAPTGLSRYVLEVLNHLVLPSNVRLTVLHTADFPFDYLSAPAQFHFCQISIKGSHPKQHIVIPLRLAQLKVDAYFYPFIDPPLLSRAAKNVFMIHDLNKLFFSKYASTENKLGIAMANLFVRAGSRIYDDIVLISNYVADELQRHIPLSPEKLHVIYHGFSPNSFEPAHPPKSVLPPPHRTAPYILYVGNNRPHKNIRTFLDAFQLIQKEHPHLQVIFAGEQSNRFLKADEYAEQLGSRHSVVVKGRVSDEELASLYCNASLFVYPSIAEGFGLPLLEAMYFRCPIAASVGSSISEIAQNAAHYFDPYRPKDVAHQILSVVNDSNRREELIANGTERLQDFSWSNTAERLLKLLVN